MSKVENQDLGFEKRGLINFRCCLMLEKVQFMFHISVFLIIKNCVEITFGHTPVTIINFSQ